MREKCSFGIKMVLRIQSFFSENGHAVGNLFDSHIIYACKETRESANYTKQTNYTSKSQKCLWAFIFSLHCFKDILHVLGRFCDFSMEYSEDTVCLPCVCKD